MSIYSKTIIKEKIKVKTQKDALNYFKKLCENKKLGNILSTW